MVAESGLPEFEPATESSGFISSRPALSVFSSKGQALAFAFEEMSAKYSNLNTHGLFFQAKKKKIGQSLATRTIAQCFSLRQTPCTTEYLTFLHTFLDLIESIIFTASSSTFFSANVLFKKSPPDVYQWRTRRQGWLISDNTWILSRRLRF